VIVEDRDSEAVGENNDADVSTCRPRCYASFVRSSMPIPLSILA
jgi:hypothetical protein